MLANWSAAEIDIFEAAYQRYGDKDFLLTVKEKLGNKTLAQIVQYYYITKKAPRIQMLHAQDRKSKNKSKKEEHFMSMFGYLYFLYYLSFLFFIFYFDLFSASP